MMVVRISLTIAFVANGASVHTVRWLGYFADRGFDVHLLTFTESAIKNVTVHYISPSKIKIPLRLLKPRMLITKIKPDVLHSFYATHHGAIGLLSGFHPFVLTVMGGDVTTATETSRIKNLMVRASLRKADLVHVSDVMLKERVEELGCNSSKILLQEWAVNTNEFSPQAKDERLRAQLGITDFYSVINAYPWEPRYGVDILIKALPYVLKEIPNVKLILLGGGTMEKELMELARKLGVVENVLFIGRVPREAMPKYLASVDVIVDTLSDYAYDRGGIFKRPKGTGIGQTNREAMSCGIPQILSDSASFKSYKWFKGLMYKQLDYRDLADKVASLLNDEVLRKKIGRESRQYALDYLNEDTIMKNWEKIYHRLSNASAA